MKVKNMPLRKLLRKAIAENLILTDQEKQTARNTKTKKFRGSKRGN